MPNPYCQFPDGPLCAIPEEMIHILYKRTNFLKKLIEDMSTEEASRLLRFLIWENPEVTALILSEIVNYVREREREMPFSFLQSILFFRSLITTVTIRELTRR